MSSNSVFSGGPLNFEVENENFGQLVYDEITKLPEDEVGHTNAETGEEMTNKEFLELSQRIAAALKKLGCGVGDIVVVSGENSFRISAVVTACALINVAFAPLDHKLRSYELKSMLSSYKPKLVFCNLRQAEDFKKSISDCDLNSPPILLDVDETVDSSLCGFSTVLSAGAVKGRPAEVENPAGTIAIVMPSSGSTGLPKGVAISHRSASCMIYKLKSQGGSWMNPGIKGRAKNLQTSHIYWISGLVSLLIGYFYGLRVFIPSLETDKILAAITKYQPVSTFMSPSELVTILKRPDLPRDCLKPLRVIATGGGMLPKFVRDQLAEKLDNPPPLMLAYGLTENVGAITRAVPNAKHGCVGAIDCGTTVKIVDHETEEVLEMNETGEVRVKADYQFYKYLGNEEATKAAYDSEGFLKTGDLGYVTEDNLLFLTGRIKTILKYRNVQVSVTAIEDLLIELPGVADVAVDGIPSEIDQYHIVALVVKAPGSDITEDDIHKYMAEKMSDSNKLRGGVKFVNVIPRNTHGKIKRKDVKDIVLKLESHS